MKEERAYPERAGGRLAPRRDRPLPGSEKLQLHEQGKNHGERVRHDGRREQRTARRVLATAVATALGQDARTHREHAARHEKSHALPKFDCCHWGGRLLPLTADRLVQSGERNATFQRQRTCLPDTADARRGTETGNPMSQNAMPGKWGRNVASQPAKCRSSDSTISSKRRMRSDEIEGGVRPTAHYRLFQADAPRSTISSTVSTISSNSLRRTTHTASSRRRLLRIIARPGAAAARRRVPLIPVPHPEESSWVCP